MKTIVKLFGLERSGTNYVEWLLKNNCNDVIVFTNQLGWKHGAIKSELVNAVRFGVDSISDVDRQTIFSHRTFQGTTLDELTMECMAKNRLAFVVVIKNPYSWYASLSKYRRFPLSPIRRNEILRWNESNQAWCEFCDQGYAPSVVLKFEELLAAPQACIAKLHKGLALDGCLSFRDIPLRIKAGFRVTSETFDKDYYRSRRYLEQFTSQDLASINEAVNVELMQRFEYDFIQNPLPAKVTA